MNLNLEPTAGDHAHRLRRLVRETFWRTVLLASICSGGLYVASSLLNRLWLFELMTHFRVQMAVVMVPLAVALLCRRRSPWSIAFTVFAASAVWSVASIATPSSQPEPGSSVLRLMSANVLLVNSHFDEFIQLVEDVDPDLLLVVEYTKQWDAKLASIRDAYPFAERYPRTHGFGMALFSKRPLHNVQAESLLDYFDAPSISCEVDVDGKRLSVVALHAISPLSSFRFDARNEQYVVLARKLGIATSARVVFGDFNATTWSPFIADFLRSTGLRDSRQGFGLQPTWPQFSWPMRIPIDHAFVSPQIHVHDRWVERDIGSDHFPIVVDVSVSR